MKNIITILFILICVKSQAQSSEELYKKGLEYFRKNELQNAKNTFEQSFKLSPEFKTYGMYVMLTISSKNFKGLSNNNLTLPFTLKLRVLNKIKNSFFFNVLNNTYLQMEKPNKKLTEFIDEKQIRNDLADSFNKRYKDNPNDFSANLNRGLSLIDEPVLMQSQLDKSYQIYFSSSGDFGIQYQPHDNFSKLVKINPNSETGYFFRGYTSRNDENVIEDYKKVLKINPNNALANLFISYLFSDKNNYNKAIFYLSKVFTIEPNKVIESIKIDGSELDILFLYSSYYKPILNYANSKDNDIRYVEYKLTKLYSEKKYNEITKICDEIINDQENKNNFRMKNIIYFRGISNFNSNNYENALTDFNKIIQIDTNISDAFAMRGATKIFLNDLSGALLDLNKAIELDDSDGYMYFYRGMVENKLGDNKNACLDLKKAIEFDYIEADSLLKEICK